MSLGRRVRGKVKWELRPRTVRWIRRHRRPLSEQWGLDRGHAIDRYYIETFLERHREDVTGVCLEVHGKVYIDRFGHDVARAEILDVDPDNKHATIVGDLRRLDAVRDDTFDCFVCTHTIHLIDDMDAAVAESYRILKPGGVLLATFPGAVGRLARRWDDHWRVLPKGAQFLFGKRFPEVEVVAYGNVVSGLGVWMGKAAEELSPDELDFEDVDALHPVVVGVRAVKPR
jgi:SAM-dependent methyltransferase